MNNINTARIKISNMNTGRYYMDKIPSRLGTSMCIDESWPPFILSPVHHCSFLGPLPHHF